MDFRKLQEDHALWSHRCFGSQPAYRALLGVSEEVGELCHAHLKAEQGIRTDEDHGAAARDAVGDIVIFLLEYCTRSGLSFVECVESAWAEVSQRDWSKHKGDGLDE